MVITCVEFVFVIIIMLNIYSTTGIALYTGGCCFVV